MKTLSFVIPMYNEEKRLEKTVLALKEGVYFAGIKLEKIIFVDDGSTDKTVLALKKHKRSIERSTIAKVSIISYPVNRGKGYAVRRGMAESNSDYTLLFDADMSTPLKELAKFLPFIEEGVPVIIGTRKNGESTVVKAQPIHRQILGRGFTFLSNSILGTKVTDFTCGFKAFSKSAKDIIFNACRIERWGYDSEIVYLATKFDLKIQEKAVKWFDDKRSKVNVLKDIFGSLNELFEIRLNDLKGLYQNRNAEFIKLQIET